MNILFLCVANCARSQLAEAIAKDTLGLSYNIQSAGSKPAGYVHPTVNAVLGEWSLKASEQHSKSTSDLSPRFIEELDLVITLCEEEVCPVIPAKTRKLHWPIPDPAKWDGEKGLQAFRSARDEIKKRLLELRATL